MHCDVVLRLVNLSVFSEELFSALFLDSFGSLISFLGFFLNLMFILVIQYKPNEYKYFKGNRIYSFIQLNSLFNTIECLIPSFRQAFDSQMSGSGWSNWQSSKTDLVLKSFSLRYSFKVEFWDWTWMTTTFLDAIFMVSRYIELQSSQQSDDSYRAHWGKQKKSWSRLRSHNSYYYPFRKIYES